MAKTTKSVMKCDRCGSVMTQKKNDIAAKKAVEFLGIPYGGSWVCLTCYPNKRKECE